MPRATSSKLTKDGQMDTERQTDKQTERQTDIDRQMAIKLIRRVRFSV